MRLAHAHAGERTHGADDVEQFADAGNMGFDLGETDHQTATLRANSLSAIVSGARRPSARVAA